MLFNRKVTTKDTELEQNKTGGLWVLTHSVVLLVGGGLKVFIWCDRLHPSKVVQHPHFGDVHLGKEPVVVSGPVYHLWVTAKEGFLGKHSLCSVDLKYRHKITIHPNTAVLLS